LTPRAVLDPGERSALVAGLIDELPDWFGIAEANRHYVDGAARREAFGVFEDGACAGLVSVEPHFGRALELWWPGVRPERHRRGIGRALVQAAGDAAVRLGLEVLAVRTLSDAHPDPGYARTRAFYGALGFHPTLPATDDAEVPLVWMLKPIGASA
jgi:GNAT superfamily N-acetyltransferase